MRDPPNPFDPTDLGGDQDELNSFAPDIPDIIDVSPIPQPSPSVLGTSDEKPIGQIVVPEKTHLASPLAHAGLSAEKVVPENRIYFREPEILDGLPEDVRKKAMEALVDEAIYGVNSGAMICRGKGVMGPEDKWIEDPCPYLAKCPFSRLNIKLPVGGDCPVEIFILRTQTQSYMREMGVNPHDVTSAFDAGSARVLASMQIQLHRAMWGEAIDPRLEKYIEQVGPGGASFMVQVSNLNTHEKKEALKIIERFGKTNMQTRREKAALTKSGFKDHSKHAAEVADRLRAVSKGSSVEVKESVQVEGPDGVMERLERVRKFTPLAGE
jgi:hypothetical protein